MKRDVVKKWAKLAMILLAAVGLCEAIQADMQHHEPSTTPIKRPAFTNSKNFSIDHDQVFLGSDDRLTRPSFIRN